MGNVEGELVIDSVVFGARLHGALDIDQHVAAQRGLFAGDRVVAETDDIGRAVFAEIFTVGSGDARIVDQHDGYLAPGFRYGSGFQPVAQPVSQPLQPAQLDRTAVLPVDHVCFHGFSGRRCVHAACWTTRR